MRDVRNRLALIAGLWTVSTVGPLIAFVLSGPFDGTVTAGELAIGVGLFVLGTVLARLGLERVSTPAERFRDGVEMAGPIAVPGVELIGAVVAVPAVGVTTVLPFGIGGALGVVAAFLGGYVADRAVIARSRASTEHRIVWRAAKRPAPRWRLVVSGVAIGAAVTLIGIALANGGAELVVVPLLLGCSELGTLLRGRWRRRYEITDDGLVSPLGFLPWENFDTYGVSDDALLLHGNVWPFGTVAFDRESIDDSESVVGALDRHLPHQEGNHEDPSFVDNIRQLLEAA